MTYEMQMTCGVEGCEIHLGEKPRLWMTPHDHEVIRELITDGFTYTMIKNVLNVSIDVIGKVARGKSGFNRSVKSTMRARLRS